MKELQGKYGSAKVFTDLVEDKAIEQIQTLLDQKFIEDSKIRIMPDVHAGAGCTIGTTMTITDKCCPNLVGVDIGCGLFVTELNDTSIDLEQLDKIIREKIPSGFNIRSDWHGAYNLTGADKLLCKDQVDLERSKYSIGTLGGGNHFIEVDRDDDGRLYLVIHSGSRHLGLEVASHYQSLAKNQVTHELEDEINRKIAALKSEGKTNVIADAVAQAKLKSKMIRRDLAYVSGTLFKDYIHDMKIVQKYAHWNRVAIAEVIVTAMHLSQRNAFTTIHNYIDTDDMILRKGAVSAKEGERLIIPINMRDGSLICVGKGNPDWNYSAPHGAGRLMSRSEAKKKFKMDEFNESMSGIYTTSVSEDTLDECPMAYKPMENIVANICDTVEIEKIIRPIYNFKASD